MTSTIRFSPASEFRRFQNEIDQLIQDLAQGQVLDKSANWKPRLDAFERENDYEFQLDLPGLKREDIEIELHDGVLTVSGERGTDFTGEGLTVLCAERRQGKFSRSVSLPKDADPNMIEATIHDGVLTLRVTKAEESKPRRIEIA